MSRQARFWHHHERHWRELAHRVAAEMRRQSAFSVGKPLPTTDGCLRDLAAFDHLAAKIESAVSEGIRQLGVLAACRAITARELAMRREQAAEADGAGDDAGADSG